MLRRSAFYCACLLGQSLAAPAGDHRLSGPYNHDNLSIFLIHGASQPRAKAFLTLQEALDQKKVVVYETGNVNQLAVENFSTEDVYIQSGDIVKGGQQDRVFPDDFLLPSKSGRVPIASFCVEQGRWTRRGSERADRFNSSTDAVATKSLKLAARQKEDQGAVWQEVAKARSQLTQAVEVSSASAGAASGGGVGVGVASASRAFAAPTSMQLALENKNVTKAAGAYIGKLSGIIDGQPDIVGYAFAINGKLNSADVYATHDLFRRMWPKLLKASSIEAVAERRDKTKSSPPDALAIQAALADAEHGRESTKDIASRLKVVMRETEKGVQFETRDRDHQGAWLHRSYVMK
jgi:hypothetical protein